LLFLTISLIKLLQDIHQTLRKQIKHIPPALPFEGHCHNEKMDLEIAKMQTAIVRAHLATMAVKTNKSPANFE